MNDLRPAYAPIMPQDCPYCAAMIAQTGPEESSCRTTYTSSFHDGGRPAFDSKKEEKNEEHYQHK